MESIYPGAYQNAEAFFTFSETNLSSSIKFFSFLNKLMKFVVICVFLKEKPLSEGK